MILKMPNEFYAEILKLQDEFITCGIEFCKRANLNTPLQNLKDTLLKIFSVFYGKEVNMCIVFDEFENLLPNSSIRKNLLSEIFLGLIINFNKNNKNAQWLISLTEAIDQIQYKLDKKENCDALPGENLVKNHAEKTFQSYKQAFLAIKNDSAELEFLNLYDGVNVRNNAEILEINDEFVVFKVDVVQILAMKQEGNAFIIKNDYLLGHIRADIVSFNVLKQTVTLKNFTQIATMNASLRKSQRVHPRKFTPATLKSASAEVSGSLYDISNGGISVISKDSVSFEKDEKIVAEFELVPFEGGLGFGICLDVVLVTDLVCNGSIRYCLKAIDDENSSLIESFTNARVQETLNELKNQAKLYR
ncbi:PilZ domain-containing protein [Campylobacter suis]|uniref:PilZ domain-containing protein n=1 Tax=Campylobacter suis TaxID=2790657 RepID=A0ABM8Q0G9_9BACT|nr:PilZ domain-containing protein [Campylobacter suis]CAD7286252.1 hypothetical protein LMG8286_00083 [Campylobacter suis]